ncbi:hypothetical protein [Arthrobacter sp. Soil764]|uniref:hypothetical protein n=1 Tax=Arthrobacter sp. Soil764 TaxID=1736403 RepID=UPI001F3A6C79|nr:hypothetical protein [Arthrobacter sp. Soil764]
MFEGTADGESLAAQSGNLCCDVSGGGVLDDVTAGTGNRGGGSNGRQGRRG